jgi:hypothetical protein
MQKIFLRVIDNNFSELKGTTIHALIPVPQSLINELIEESLRGNKNIASAPIVVQPQNRVSIRLKTTLLPWVLDLRLKLDGAVDFASFSSPKVRAWLENNRLLGSLGSVLNVLPEGIKLYGNQVVIDLGAFVKKPEQKRLLGLVKAVDIRTEAGKVILDVRMDVE